MAKRKDENFFHHVLRVIFQNWPFKLISLLLAIVLWAGLISQDPTLTREKVFNDVPVTITGAETLKRSGFIVVNDLQKELQSVSFAADVPQQQYNTVTYSNYNVRLDLSRITEVGKQEVRLSSTSTTTYGNVVDIYPASVEVQVEEYISRYRIPVTLKTIGSAPEGYYAYQPQADPSILTVSGPASLVNRVARAEAELNLSILPAEEAEMYTAIPFTLVDAQGNEVDSSLIEVTSDFILMDSVISYVDMRPQKELQMSELNLTTGTLPDGYVLKSMTVTPQRVIAAGDSTTLDTLDTLFADSAIDLSNLTATTTQTLRIRRPTGLVYLSSDSVTVTLEIEHEISERTFDRVRLSTVGNDRSVAVVMDTSIADVTLTGPRLLLDTLRTGDVSLVVDVTGLDVGEYDLPVECITSIVDQTMPLTYVTDPEKVHVTITGK